jgi:chromosome segregation ATPase
MARTVKKNIAALAAAGALALGVGVLPVHGADAGGHDSETARLDKAAQSNDGRPADQARAKAAAAQAHWNKANDLLNQINTKELSNQRTIAHLRRLGEALNWSNLAGSGLEQSDPKAALADYDRQIAAIRGDAGGSAAVWSAGKSATLPTASALKKKIGELEADVSKRQGEIKSLNQQRDQLNAQADKFAAQSDAAKGRQSVDDFKKASDLRKNADDVQRKIDLAQSQLTPRQDELAVAKAEYQTLQKTVTQLEQERAALAAQWDALQKQIQNQHQSAQKFFSNEGADGQDTISAQLGELNRGLDEVRKLRDQAADELNRASSGFTAAANAAQNLQNALRAQASNGGDGSEAGKTLAAVVDPQAYQLQKAAALAALAQLKASEASSLRDRLEVGEFLSPIIQKAGLAAPAELGDVADLKKKAKAAQKEAEKAFAETDQLFTQLGGGAERNSATVLHILTLYNWSQMAAGAGDAKNAAARLQAAKALADNAAKNNVPLPPLPAEIAPTAAAAAPATKPA